MANPSVYNFKRIKPVPRGKGIVEIVLSKTQRKTATVVHKKYEIGRIRRFYATKIKFAQQAFHDRISTIIAEFPKLNDIHPFYADLINVEVDKDHYKLALGEINNAKHLIDKIAKDYLRFLKYADSLYRCKCLKRAALGRMAKLMRQNSSAMTWLEEVRQKLARMPSIDPNAPTILLCGYPNVGKTSFLNKSTRAFGEVKPYAFTTQDLYVGHLEYETIRFQVIDSPGLLERPVQERNTIEMKSITALAHLRSCILFILDITDACGASLEKQIKLFDEIKVLFVNKPVIIALNKVDVCKRNELGKEEQDLLNQFEAANGKILEMSTGNDDIAEVKLKACTELLKYRVTRKLMGRDVSKIENRLHVAMPVKRDEKERLPFVPIEIQEARTRKLERELEREMGDEYFLDLKKNYLLKNEDEKYDIVPEIWNGKNVADFVDPDLERKLAALKAEEAKRAELGLYDPSSSEDEEDREIRLKAEAIREKKKLAMVVSGQKRRVKAPRLPRTAKKIETEEVASSFKKRGVDIEIGEETNFGRARSRSAARVESRKRKREESTSSRPRSTSRPPRDKSGLRDEVMRKKAKKLANVSQRPINLNARKGEADRRVLMSKPKHLFSGKRKMGKTTQR